MSSPFFKRSVDDKLSLTGFDTSKSKFIHFADSVCKISDLRTHFPDTVWGNWSLKEKARRCLAFWLSLKNVVLKVADSRPLKPRVETPVKIYREPHRGVRLPPRSPVSQHFPRMAFGPTRTAFGGRGCYAAPSLPTYFKFTPPTSEYKPSAGKS